MWIYIGIFLASCLFIFISSKWLSDALSRISMFLGLKEFVVAFCMMALASSLPNLFVGIISATKGVPELAFGDVMGGNIFDLSIGVALAVLISKGGLSANSRTVQGSSIFTIGIALLPLLLILDNNLSRADGGILILSFIGYLFWLFSKKDRFCKNYDDAPQFDLLRFFKDLGLVVLGISFLLIGAAGIVKSAIFFSTALNMPLSLIGILVVGVGSSLPETFFSISAAKKGHSWMILGDLMGGIIIIATLVLGIVVLIKPIHNVDLSPFAITRAFLILAAVLFFFMIRTGRKITKKEAILLLMIYIGFVFTLIFWNK